MTYPPYLAGPVGQISWGMSPDHGFNSYSSDPASYVDECSFDGIDSHAIQVIPENEAGGIALHDAARAKGKHFGGWTNVPQVCGDIDQLHNFLDLFARMKCGFFHANIEERWALGGTDLTFNDLSTVNNCHSVFIKEFRKRFPRTPAWVQTNYGGFELRTKGGPVIGYDRTAAAVYYKHEHPMYCMHEDYWVNNVNLTPINGDFNAHNNLGWTRPSLSTAGIFGSETGRTDPNGERLFNTIEMEIPRLQASGRHHVEIIWTMEYMTDYDRYVLRTHGLHF